MFNDEDDLAAYEDELYREDSSSDESIDSEVETYLYSQVHYSQNLNEDSIDKLEDQKKDNVVENLKTKPQENNAVIVISDSDDIRASDSSAVIILSDTFEEESVYSSKIKNKVTSVVRKPENQSTPKVTLKGKKLSKLQETKSPNSGKNYKGEIVQQVLVIKESSEDEVVSVDEEMSPTSESDQSDVENWMLLGRAREDGDASISLNLMADRSASNEGDDGLEWSIIERDSEAQILNYTPVRRSSQRYYAGDKNVICRNCNYRGHLSKNCPQPRKLPACCLCGRRGHLQFGCTSQYCTNCFMPGHVYEDCTERPCWQKKCHRCYMTGHYADACPEIWRQYHLTVKPGPIKKSSSACNPKDNVYCCNCGRKGHCGYECNGQRMYSSMYPNCELVFSYDQTNHIWKRSQRAKWKLNELQEAGLVPLQAEGGPVTLQAEREFKQNALAKTQLQKQKEWRKRKHQKDKNGLPINSKKQFKNKNKKFFHFVEDEEPFPRGKLKLLKKNIKANRKKKPKDDLFKDVYRNDKCNDQLNKGKRKRKKWRPSDVDPSLLKIKQRKKKAKTH
ncbi:zinc finger CCHC domain-containing protein 7 isoform X2 [Engystomops pustulosus]